MKKVLFSSFLILILLSIPIFAGGSTEGSFSTDKETLFIDQETDFEGILFVKNNEDFLYLKINEDDSIVNSLDEVADYTVKGYWIDSYQETNKALFPEPEEEKEVFFIFDIKSLKAGRYEGNVVLQNYHNEDDIQPIKLIIDVPVRIGEEDAYIEGRTKNKEYFFFNSGRVKNMLGVKIDFEDIEGDIRVNLYDKNDIKRESKLITDDKKFVHLFDHTSDDFWKIEIENMDTDESYFKGEVTPLKDITKLRLSYIEISENDLPMRLGQKTKIGIKVENEGYKTAEDVKLGLNFTNDCIKILEDSDKNDIDGGQTEEFEWMIMGKETGSCKISIYAEPNENMWIDDSESMIIVIADETATHELSIKNVHDKIKITQGDTYSIDIAVDNSGTQKEFNVNSEVIGIDESWWSVDGVIEHEKDDTNTYKINFNIPEEAEVGKYPLFIIISSDDTMDSFSSLLLVMPKEIMEEELSIKIEESKTKIKEIEDNFEKISTSVMSEERNKIENNIAESKDILEEAILSAGSEEWGKTVTLLTNLDYLTERIDGDIQGSNTLTGKFVDMQNTIYGVIISIIGIIIVIYLFVPEKRISFLNKEYSFRKDAHKSRIVRWLEKLKRS